MLINWENKKQRLAPFGTFLKRLTRFGLFAIFLILISLGIGMLGYHHLAELNWIDSFYMASMILTGMGPTIEMKSTSAKLFSSIYALYSGVAFLSICAVFFTPVIHRFLHKLHVDHEES
jgi:hypothetical protein